MLTNNERKVQIARQVIEHIESGEFTPRRRSVLTKNVDYPDNRPGVGDFNCYGCAIGSMFMIMAQESDNALRTSIDDIPNYMSPLFSIDELSHIEAAFEDGSYILTEYINDIDTKYDEEFYLMHQNDRDRLMAICQNIIDNGGVFSATCKVEFPEEVAVSARELVIA